MTSQCSCKVYVAEIKEGGLGAGNQLIAVFMEDE